MHILVIQSSQEEMKPIMDFTSKHKEQILSILPSTTITVINDTEKSDSYIKDADVIITAYGKPIPLEKATKLQWVQLTSAGANNLPKTFIESDILLTNASGVHPIPIAEHVIAFMLMFAHQLHALHRTQIEKKTWEYAYSTYPIEELYGKTVIIFGLGRIGSRIAQLAKGFDMKILAMVRDMSKKNQYVDDVFTQDTMATFLPRADFVVNAMPLTSQTHHFFNKKIFAMMKPSVYFINIGRGPVVNEKDLIAALKHKTIKGAGLDVTEIEPLPNDSPLWKMKNVIITPHSSGQTPEYMNRVIDIFCENLQAFLKKRPMPNLVDKKRGY